MNCKQGDMAMIVGNTVAPEHNGAIVCCARAVLIHDGIWWEIDPKLPNRNGPAFWAVADHRLRPIRPGDISDEEVRDLYSPSDALRECATEGE